MRLETIDLEPINQAIENGQAYFGSQVAGIQSKPIRYAHMTDLVRWICFQQSDQSDLSILEIGSWVGASAITWGLAINRFNEGKGLVACVDPWQEYRSYRKTGQPPDDRDNALLSMDIPMQLFRHNVSVYGLEKLITPIKSTGLEILPQFMNESFNVIYLDGNRLFANILEEIEEAKPKVKDGGVLSGDDLTAFVPQVNKSEMLKAIDQNIVQFRDSKSGRIYFPGLSLAIEQCFDRVSVKDGFWFAQKDVNKWKPIDFSTSKKIPEHIKKWI